MLLSPGLRLLGDRILNALAALFRTGLDTFSGVFGHDFGSMTNVVGAPLRGPADFRRRMPNDMTRFSCSFVHVVDSVLANSHTYTENH